jgi:hypothetical protein
MASLSGGRGNIQLFANPLSRILGNLAVSGNRSPPAVCRVFPDGVFSALTDEPAFVPPQMIEQITPFHGTAPWGTTATRDAAESNR